jgi:hypothetical protein
MTGGTDGCGHSRQSSTGRTRVDDRAVSEFAGVAVLVTLTVLITASVGVYALVGSGAEEGEVDANFSFRYIAESDLLIVSHDRGDQIPAGNLSIESDAADARWSTLAGRDDTAPVGTGDTVQVSERNAYGQPVSPDTEVRVVHRPPEGNATVLDRWTGG